MPSKTAGGKQDKRLVRFPLGFAAEPHQGGYAPGPCRGTSVPQTLCAPNVRILATPLKNDANKTN